MNIYEQKEVKALEDEIDKLFDNLKKSIYDITVARRNWLDKVKGWLGFVGKSPVYRQQYPESRLGLSLHQYSEIKGLIGNLEGQLNEVGATDLLGHEYVDDILNSYRDKLKTIVRTHVDAISRAAPTPAPAAPPAVPRPTEPSMPAVTAEEEPEDVLGLGEEEPKLKQIRRSKKKLGWRPKGERSYWPRNLKPGEEPPEEEWRKKWPKEPQSFKLTGAGEEGTEASEESPEVQAAKAEKKAAAKAAATTTQNELRNAFLSKESAERLLSTPEGKLHVSKNVNSLLGPNLDIAMAILGIPVGEKKLNVKEKKMRVRASLKASLKTSSEPAAKQPDFPDPEAMDSPALDAAAKQVEEEPDVSGSEAGEPKPSPEAAAEHEDPTFEKKIADQIRTHIGEIGDEPTSDDIMKLGGIAQTMMTMTGNDLARLDDEGVTSKHAKDIAPDIPDMDDDEKEDYLKLGTRILGHMKSKEESIQNQVDKYKKLLREDYRPEILRKQVAKLPVSEKVNFYRQKLASFRDR